MVASVAEVVNEDVPPTVSTPLCVRLPSVLTTVRLPSVLTTVRLPPTLDVSRTRPLARLLVRLALPVAPVVLSDAAPLSALPALVSVMSAFEAEVVNEDVPPTVRAPVCVRLPTVSIIVRLPPTFDAPNTVALALVSCALPFAPLVLSDAAPVSRLALVSVMVASVAEVVNDDVPPTVSTPLCVRFPPVTVSFRPMPEDATLVAGLFVRLASPLLPPVLLWAIAPFGVLLVLVSVIVAFVAEVVTDEVPPTVRAPVCVRLPTVSVTVRLPPTFEAPSTVALALVRLALPLAPLVLSDAAPVSRLALASVMVASVAEVVNDEVPVTVSTPVCVRLPSVLPLS